MNRALSVVALAGLVVGLSSLASGQTVLTQWNFNSTVGTTTPSTGAGTASLVGGTTATFASGNASGGSTDPVTDATDFGWNTTTYPAATATSGTNETLGVQFLASTLGFQNITVSWDQRHSNTNSRFWAFFYTIDAGATWTRLSVSAANANPGTTPAGGAPANAAGLFGPNGTFSAFDGTVTGAGDDWFNGRSVNLTGIAGVDNNPNFGFRVLASFGDGATYQASSAGVYGGGTARFDMATVSGTLIPTPGAVALLGLGGLVAGRRRR
jgi:hypothetical protein